MTWDILVCSIPHRHELLCALLDELDRQLHPANPSGMGKGVGVRVYRDNLEASYGDKCQALVNSSSADYVSFLDDDDWVAPDFVAAIADALNQRPDYVGFLVRYTEDGVVQVPVEHSLRHAGWENRPDMLTRDLVHFNPIRRELALLGRWEGGNGADRRWADQVRATGHVQHEVWIPWDMYHYRNTTHDTFLSTRHPLSAEQIHPLPAYPWLTELTS